MKALKRYSIVLSSIIVLIAITYVFACSFADVDSSYYHFFTPAISRSPFMSFYRYTDDTFFDQKAEPITDFNKINVDDWVDYFGNKINSKELELLLYKKNTKYLESLVSSFSNGKFTDSMRTELKTTIVFPDKKAVNSFLTYLRFAKRCEVYCAYRPTESYNYETHEFIPSHDPRKDKNVFPDLIKAGLNFIKNSDNNFITGRYQFQLIRLYYHSGEYQKCIDYYKSISKAGLLKSMYYRMLGYSAGSYYKLKNYSYANYLYSRIFNKYPAMRKIVFLSFHPVEEADWQECFKYARTNSAKSALWAIMGIINDPLRAMKEIYKIKPKSKFLDILLTRAVNIQEEEFLRIPYPDTAYNDSSLSISEYNYKFAASKVDTNLISFVKMVATEKKSAKQYLWNLAGGYLLSAKGDFNEASGYYTRARHLAGSDNYLQMEIKKIEFVSQIAQAEKIDESFESKILDTFSSFNSQFLKLDYHLRYDSLNLYAVLNWTDVMLSYKYSQQGELIKAECLASLSHPEFYRNPKLREQMLLFMNKKKKTKYEKFILSRYSIKEKDIYEFEAVQLFLQGKVEDALSKLEKCPASGGKELPADPFLIHINDCHDCDFEIKNRNKFTKLQFVKMAAAYINRIKANHDPKAYFALGNAFYNTTYFGNARRFYETDINPYSNSLDIKKKIRDVGFSIMDCSLAEKYYMLAYNSSTDNEFKAKCLFMAAKCQQNNFFVNAPKGFKDDFKAGSYFYELKDNFSNTKYYKEIIRECGYFSTFVSKWR